MGKIGANDTQHPALAPFVATVNDAELTRLTEAYQAADEHIRALEARRDAAQQEIVAIDAQIGELPAPAMDKALTQRARLSGLLAGLPTALAKAQRERVLVNLAWLRRVRDVALAEAERLHAELDPIMEQARADRQAIDRAETAKEFRQLSADDFTQQHEAWRNRQAERQTQAQPLRDRLARLEEVANVCEIRAQRYDGTIKIDAPQTWPHSAARQAVGQAA